MKYFFNPKNELNLYLLGNPNSGKTKFFNVLTNQSAEVANYSGVTVGVRRGNFKNNRLRHITIYDLPGTHSIIPRSADEFITSKAIWKVLNFKKNSLIAVIIDVTNVSKAFYLLEQIAELLLPFVVVLTMSDKISKEKLILIKKRILLRYNVLVFGVSSENKFGINSFVEIFKKQLIIKDALLREYTDDFFNLNHSVKRFWIYGGKIIAKHFGLRDKKKTYFYGGLALFYVGFFSNLSVNKIKNKKLKNWVFFAKKQYSELSSNIILCRYKNIDKIFYDEWKIKTTRKKCLIMDKIDKILLHPFFGSIVVFLIFIFILELLFYIPDPLIFFSSSMFSYCSDIVRDILPSYSLFSSLVIDGVIVGIGSVLSFVPLIAILFFFVGVLEESGYLSRVIFLLDSVIRKVGLPGKALISLLSGFACSVPAIMSTRIIESKKQRLLTIMVIPFIPCSARLPVYGLLISSFFSSLPPIFGIINPSVIVLLLLYCVGIMFALLFSFFLKLILRGYVREYLLLELPEYKIPKFFSIVRDIAQKIKIFLIDVGTIVLAMTVIMWCLFTFPLDNICINKHSISRNSHIENSYAGKIGKSLEPIISPLGFDWKIGVGLLASFSAREVFVSTIGIAFGLEQKSENQRVLNKTLVLKKNEKTGKNIFTPLIASSLLVFFALAMQCVSTIIIVKKETNSLIWPFLQWFFMTAVAWITSFIVYRCGIFFGLD